MLSSLALISPLLTIIGFSFFFSSTFSARLSSCLFVATSCLGLLEFFFALSGHLQGGTALLLSTGLLFFAFYSLRDWLKPSPSRKANWLTIAYYLVFSFFLAIFVWGLRFRSIDDYSFWGTMSKFLFIFHKLPNNGDFIADRFLTYTPGVACFHYLFYFAAGKYSQFLGYFAQGTLFLSAFMVLFDAEKLRTSLYRIAIAYIFLSIGFGTIFARMEVDALVATFVFTIIWMIYQNRDKASQYFLVFFPILALSLIKEIGLLFAIMTIVALIARLRLSSPKKMLFPVLLSLVGVLLLKGLWIAHCNAYGFHSFAQKIDLTQALNALNPFNTYYHPAQVLFLKAVFGGAFGRILVWPNLVTYLGLAFLWFKLSKEMLWENYRAASQLKWIFIVTLVLYLLMLYLLQAIVFDVGHRYQTLLDFNRYFNMLLIPFTLFSLLLYFEEKSGALVQNSQQWLPRTITAVALIFLVSGKIERTFKYYLPQTIYPLVETVAKELPNDSNWLLCLKEPPEPSYDISMPLAYFFMPHRIVVLDESTPRLACNYVMSWPNRSIPAQAQVGVGGFHTRDMVLSPKKFLPDF